jgi:hypothetical protein
MISTKAVSDFRISKILVMVKHFLKNLSHNTQDLFSDKCTSGKFGRVGSSSTYLKHFVITPAWANIVSPV